MSSTNKPFTLQVEGMHCAGCVRRVQGALEKIPGVVVDEVVVGQAQGSFDPGASDASSIEQAVTKAGYKARVVVEESAVG